MSTDVRERLQEALADRYRLDRELGRGGMATVYLAHDLKHDRSVALKVLHPELAATVGPERFQREIRTTARLQHPHILTVLDSGQAAGHLWYTMPFVEGESLRDRLIRERQLPLDDALHITREVADALGYAHSQGVVHRDIKPENIMLTGGHALAADFGVARALQAAGGDQLTETGMSVGTPAYMSPEQSLADPSLDGRSDLYSLGCVLYEMLAGEAPYTGISAQAIVAKRLREPVPHVRTVREAVPMSVDRVLERVLAKAPADRFATAEAFRQALTAAAPEDPAATTRTTRQPARTVPRRRLWLAIGAGAFVIVAISGILLGVRLGLVALAGGTGTLGTPNGSAADIKAIAVLPFENQGDSADAYFADGMSDAIRGKLAALPRLRVIARASSTQYRQSGRDLRDIGRELNVQYILTATVDWDKHAAGSSRVRVSPELVQVDGVDRPVTRWQEPFDQVFSDVFAVQAEIAGKVATALQVALDPAEQRALSQAPTGSLQAYDAFLQGEEESDGLGTVEPAALTRAVVAYRRALAADSSFAPGWSQLARALAHLSYWVEGSSAVQSEARAAADRAAHLAPQHPGGWIALGDVAAKIDFNPALALQYYSRARRLGAAGPDVLTSSAFAERVQGQWDSVEAHLREAYTLDPRSVEAARVLVETLNLLRRHDEALALADRALAIAPHNLTLIADKTNIYLARGDLDSARAWLESVKAQVGRDVIAAYLGAYGDIYWALNPVDQRRLLQLPPKAFGSRKSWAEVLAQVYDLHGDSLRARAYADSALQVSRRDCGMDGQCHALKAVQLALAGRDAEAIQYGEHAVRIAPVSKDAYVGPYLMHQLARVYVMTGHPTKALELLAGILRVPYYVSPGWLKIDPTMAALRSNPRFELLVNGQ